MRTPNTRTLKTINKLIIAVFVIGSAFLLLSCEKEPEYVCFDTFQGEEVIIEGVEVTIYNKVIVCEDIYYY